MKQCVKHSALRSGQLGLAQLKAWNGFSMIFEVQNQLTISSATGFFHFSPLCRVRLLCKSHDMYLPAGRPQEIEILAEVLIPQLIGIYLHEEFFFD